MTTKTTLRVGRRNNRNETLVRDIRWAGLKSMTRVRAGDWQMAYQNLKW